MSPTGAEPQSESVDAPIFGKVVVRPLALKLEKELGRLFSKKETTDRAVVEATILCCFRIPQPEGDLTGPPPPEAQVKALSDEDLNRCAEIILQKVNLKVSDSKPFPQQETPVKTLVGALRLQHEANLDLLRAAVVGIFGDGQKLKGLTVPEFSWISDRTIGYFKEMERLGESIQKAMGTYSPALLQLPTPLDLGIGKKPARLAEISTLSKEKDHPLMPAAPASKPAPPPGLPSITPLADHFDGLKGELGQVSGHLELLVAKSEASNKATVSLIGDFAMWRDQQAQQAKAGARLQMVGLWVAVVAFVVTAVCSIWGLSIAVRNDHRGDSERQIKLLEEISKGVGKSAPEPQKEKGSRRVPTTR